MMWIRLGCILLVACGKVVDSAAVDAAADSAVDTTAPPRDAAPACGDGHRDPGEICFGAPITISAKDLAYDAHLADIDGDGDLDLVYLISDQLVFHLQTQHQFAANGLDGPAVAATCALSLQLNATAPAELVVAGSPALNVYARTDQGTYTTTGTIATTTSCTAIAAGKITGGAVPDIATLYGSAVHLARFDANLNLAELTPGSASGGHDLAVGALDSDGFADVVVAGSAGVTFLRGSATGLGASNLTPHSAATDAVAVGDIDGDHNLDIAFVEAGNAGHLGVMRSDGSGGFLSPVAIAVDHIGGMLETADLDGDGHADFITVRTQTGSNAVLIALGQPDGTLAAPVALPIDIIPDYLRVDADFNGDGVNDIVITDTHGKAITILPSNP
jgi:hypothetical protein